MTHKLVLIMLIVLLSLVTGLSGVVAKESLPLEDSKTWLTGDNSRTHATTNFLGIADIQSLVVKTNGAERIHVDAFGGNGTSAKVSAHGGDKGRKGGGGEEPPPEEPPIERETWTNAASRIPETFGRFTTSGVEWEDATGTGTAVATFGHVGCCERDSVWPSVNNRKGGIWIWKEQKISSREAEEGDQVSFFDRFCRGDVETVTEINLLISADNAYEVYYVDPERNRISDLLAADDEWRTVDPYSLPEPDDPDWVCQDFEIEVVNFPIEGSNGNNNPAGLNYDLRVQGTRAD